MGKVVAFGPLKERTVLIVHSNGVREEMKVLCRSDEEAMARVFAEVTFYGMPAEVSIVP